VDGALTRREKCQMLNKFWSESLNGRGHFGELNVDGTIILKT